MPRLALLVALVAAVLLAAGAAAEAKKVRVEICGLTVQKHNARRVLGGGWGGQLDGDHIEASFKAAACWPEANSKTLNGLGRALHSNRMTHKCHALPEAGTFREEVGPCNTDGATKMKTRSEAACQKTWAEYSRPTIDLEVAEREDKVRIQIDDIDFKWDDVVGGVDVPLVVPEEFSDEAKKCHTVTFHYWTMSVNEWNPSHGIDAGKLSYRIIKGY